MDLMPIMASNRGVSNSPLFLLDLLTTTREFVLILPFILMLCGNASGQRVLPSLHVHRATGPIVIDAHMDEEDWRDANVAGSFQQVFPFDSSKAVGQTEVRVTYDDKAIYIYAVMHRTNPGGYVTPSLRRDFRGEAYDALVAQFDTYLDRTNAFQFGVNPFSVQREGTVANGGATSDDLFMSWDNKWYSAARITETGWECEFAIPFKTLRFKQGLSTWHANFYRIDSQLPERSVWSPVSRVYPIQNMATMGDLVFDQPLEHPGGNVSLIPYVAAKSNQDFEAGAPESDEGQFGGDAKVAVGPALNLDLTANPDFSQVEVDDQVTNLNRFEIFYPEKRQFFLENADLFANFGYSNARPFFSRRIGVTRDPSTGQNISNPIYGGARLSGKIDNNWRIGLMTMQAAPDKSIKLPSINYAVAAVQRKLFARSNIGFMFINKQSIGAPTGWDTTGYNRMAGVDFNFASRDNRWNGKVFYHRTFDQQPKDSAYSTSLKLIYRIPKIDLEILVQDVGANFNPEVGYTPRKRFRRIAPEAYYYWYPRSKLINNHGPGTDIDYIWNDLYGATDWDANLWYQVKFQNSASGFIRIRRDYTFLYFPFDPSGSGALELPTGTGYYYNNVILGFQSNIRRKFNFSFQSRIGEYFNGHRQNIDGSLNLRLQPHAVISLSFSYNRIRLPEPYGSSDLVLLGPKFDFTFSRNVFWTTYVQYNSQINNMNINSRLQWRFKPVSDFFLVYTDNYFAETNSHDQFFYVGQPKLRAIVLKLTYWLNL